MYIYLVKLSNMCNKVELHYLKGNRFFNSYFTKPMATNCVCIFLTHSGYGMKQTELLPRTIIAKQFNCKSLKSEASVQSCETYM